VLEESRARIEALRAQRASAPPPEEADGGGKSKKKRKKGAAGEDMGDFYVDDAQPIERLPKSKKSEESQKVSCARLLTNPICVCVCVCVLITTVQQAASRGLEHQAGQRNLVSVALFVTIEVLVPACLIAQPLPAPLCGDAYWLSPVSEVPWLQLPLPLAGLPVPTCVWRVVGNLQPMPCNAWQYLYRLCSACYAWNI
jgi:hypothetical protein